jgi:(p)ppGpp synthase/HD superfamily hydrolase
LLRIEVRKINHLIEVVEPVAGSSNALDTNLVRQRSFHDTVEDTSANGHELERLFGPDVAALVLEVTDKSFPKKFAKRAIKNATSRPIRADA